MIMEVDRKDLDITHNDFLRIYPKVVTEEGKTADLRNCLTDCFEVDWEPAISLTTLGQDGNRKISVAVSKELTRRVGSLRFPYVHVKFCFFGLTEADVGIFMKRFDRAFHKGGG